MRAISPGRPQSKRQALCTAQWDGLRLVAYISGNTVIILDGPRNIIQTLSVDDTRSLTAITIEESSGRIAVCDEQHVHIYVPVGREEEDLRWTHTKDINLQDADYISCLSWGSEEELLIGGSQLWLYYLSPAGEARLIWQQKIANPVALAAFSNDSELIASCGQHDRIVKIWRRLSYELDNTRFDVAYLPHPAAVTNIHWRKPWHGEQALDNLLYTFCTDNQIRLWTYSDPHSLSVMQLIATVDANASIQPRRLSVGSMSHRRFVLILDSRDFLKATEHSLQQSRSQNVDHALEHLVEVANRSPEICVIFDGLGHMCAWGLENAGCRSSKPAVVFNVTLVDDVKIQLNSENEDGHDLVQFCSFAGGTDPAALSLLIHSFSGTVDWYESPIARFFDTSTQEQRLQLVSSWSGHDLAIDHIACAAGGAEIVSWTDDGQAILWAQTATGALQRKCQIASVDAVKGVILSGESSHMISLHEHYLALWNLLDRHATQVFVAKLQTNSPPTSARLLPMKCESKSSITFIVEFEDSTTDIWQAWLPASQLGNFKTNGVHDPLEQIRRVDVSARRSSTRTVACDFPTNDREISIADDFSLITVDDNGTICGFSADSFSIDAKSQSSDTLHTYVAKPLHVRATPHGLSAMTDESGKRLFIFDLAQRSREWSHEFGGPDHVQKMAWTTTKTGSAILFVSFSYHAFVIGQARYSFLDGSNCWTILQNISLRDFTTNFIGDIGWLESSDLAIAAGNQIFVIETFYNQDESHGQIVDKRPTGQSIVQIVEHQNQQLPIFHPVCLQYITWQGDHQQVAEILSKLFEKLKFFADGDTLDDYLDQSPAYWVSPQRSKHGHPNHRDVQETHAISEIQETLEDYIMMSTIPQLTEDDRSELAKFVSAYAQVEIHQKSLDENGLRYLFALYSTPDTEHMPWSSFAFASQSTSQEALLNLVVRHHNDKLTWDVARRTGLFIWLTDSVALRTQFENVARAEYVKHEDRNPVDCSLYYLALNKKSVLQGLWRMTNGVREKENTMKLLANNFDDPRWKSTALKNAYALISKRRFEYAAAFFLLGGSLKDAVYVCIRQLDDPQLAIAIARVWDRDIEQSSTVLQDLLSTTILPETYRHEHGRWIAVWANTLLEQPSFALQAITRPLHPETESQSTIESLPSLSYKANDPLLALAFQQIRDELFRHGKWIKGILDEGEERDYIRRTASWLRRAGLGICATQLQNQWDYKMYQAATTRHEFDHETSASDEKIWTKDEQQTVQLEKKQAKKPPPTQFHEPSANSLLDSFGF